MKKKSIFPPFLAVACVAIGQHVGPGVAGGASIVGFFGKYGMLAFLTPFISFLVVAFVVYFSVEYARRHQITGYADFATKFYSPVGKAMVVVFDVVFLLGFLVAGASCLAGFGSLYEQFLNINSWLAIGICIVIVILLCLFGAELLRIASSGMVFAIVALLILVVIVAQAFGTPDLGAAAEASAASMTASFVWDAILKGIIYGCNQAQVCLALLSVSDTLSSKKESKKMVVALFIGNVFVILCQMLTLVSYSTQIDITAETLPVYTILTMLGDGFSWLKYVYVLLVSLAIISSVCSVTFALIGRWGKYIKLANTKVRDFLIAAVGLAALIAVSSFGLLALAVKGNTICGYVSIVTLVIPILLLGAYRLKQSKDLSAEAVEE